MKNDLISRQWLIECVDEGWIKFNTEKDENRFIHLVRDIAPSAQPKDECEYWDSELSFCALHRPSAQPSTTDTNVGGTSDTISRQAAIKAICEDGTMLERQGKYTMTMAERKQKDADILDTLPPAQPTLYGYSIEFLAMVAEIMKKENVDPGEALQLFKSASYIAELVRAEWYENVQRQMEQMFAGGQDGTV